MTLADFNKSASTGTSTSDSSRKTDAAVTASGWSLADLRRDSESNVAPKAATTQGTQKA